MTETAGFGRYRFNASDGRLSDTGSDAAITLRPQVGRLLAAFLARPGEVIDRETLCREVWGEGAVVDFEAGLAALVRELRKALTEVGANAEMIETIPRRGYRFRKPEDTPTARRWKLLSTVVAGASALLVAAVLWFSADPEIPVPESPAAMSLAILPFERYGDLDREPVHADLLLPDALLARFWRLDLEGLELIGRASLRPYAGRDDVVAAVAEDLGVSLLIEGNVVADAAGWEVTARLLQVPGGRVLWGATVTSDEEIMSISATADRLISDFHEHFSEISAAFHGGERAQRPD